MPKELTPEEKDWKDVAEQYGLDPEDEDTRKAVSVRRAARELDRRAAERNKPPEPEKKKSNLW